MSKWRKLDMASKTGHPPADMLKAPLPPLYGCCNIRLGPRECNPPPKAESPLPALYGG